MSIAVVIGVHDGLVLAADSASSLTVSSAPNITHGVVNVYDNANKIFNLCKGRPIGCVAFGSGSIGNSSVATLIKDLRVKLRGQELGFDAMSYTMKGVADIVGKFLADECDKPENAAQKEAINIGLIVAGYSAGSNLGESWTVKIDKGVASDPVIARQANEAGISWGGQAEVVSRIMVGYSPKLFDVLARVSGPPQQQPGEIRQQLTGVLRGLQAELVFAPMPIQDAIDLGRFLVHSAIMWSRFHPGASTVGGPIEIAAITKHEGFRWIERKHYFDRSLNQEPER
jgi:hypothetical protein